MSKQPAGWQLFDSCFKEGEEVVVIDTDDRFHWGRLGFVRPMEDGRFENGCTLTRPGKVTAFNWDDVRFMAHDGFPVRKLVGADGSPSIEALDTTNIQNTVRQALSVEFPGKFTGRFGDPFDIENVTARLYHPGNGGHEYWAPFFDGARYHSVAHREEAYAAEEVIVMKAADGARGELWDVPTLYQFQISSN